MKAAVIYEHGGPGSIHYVARFPDPKPAAGEVLVRVKATALNYHDIFTRRGMPGIKVPLPCIMGIDFAGEIAALGEGVRDWAIGDRVMMDPVDRVSAGGLLGEMRPGGLAEYCAVPTHNLMRLPANVPYELAACLPVAYGTALRMMVTIGQVKAGEKVLILGASGGVGTCCVQLAKLAGAEVIVCASSADKLARLKDLGADHGIDYSKEDFVKWIYSKFGKPHRRSFEGGVDVVVNFTGGDTWVPSLKTLHRQGRILTCGATAGFDPKEDLRFIWTYELNIRGSNGWMREDLTALLNLLGSGKLKPIIDRELSLADTNEAFRLLEDRLVFGKVIVMTDNLATKLSAADVQAMFDRSPFIGWLGLQVVSLDHERQEIMVRMAMRSELERRVGTRQFHGGPIAALIDIAGDFAIGMLIGGGVPTMNFRTDYLRPAIGEALIATARVRRAGKTVAIVDIEVFDDENRLVALGRGTYASSVG